MWKQLFALLLSLHLLLIAAVAAWYLRLPRATDASPSVPSLATAASPASGIDVQIGQQAVNAFLQQALKNQPEVNRILATANITMGETWTGDIGIKIRNGVVPFNITFVPTVSSGRLDLQIAHADVGSTTVTSTLINVIQLLRLPHYVTFIPGTDTLEIDLSALPTGPVEVHALSYSGSARTLTVLVNLVPSQ